MSLLVPVQHKQLSNMTGLMIAYAHMVKVFMLVRVAIWEACPANLLNS